MSNCSASVKRDSNYVNLRRQAVASVGIATALTAAALSPASLGNRKDPESNTIEFVSTHTELPTSQIAGSLRNLDKLLPNQSQALYEYARVLADSLNPSLVPDGFIHQARTTLASIYNNSPHLDSRTKLIFEKLTKDEFIDLNNQIPLLASSCCRPDFALAVKAHSSGPDNWLIDYFKKTERAVMV